MPSEVQFIVSDGNLSIEVKRAHRRLVRSHVTAQRYQQKRERDAKAYEQARQKAQITTPFPPGSSPGQSGEHPTVIESSEGPNAMGYRSSNPNVMVDRSPRRPDNNNAKSPQLQGRNYAGNDDLKLEKDGGHLIAVDFAPSPFAYVGNGLSDPFVRIPPIFSPRMGKHMFYYVNVLMPRMNPSYTTNLVRQTFGCKVWLYTDELTLYSMLAHSATSHAMVTGDVVRYDLRRERSSGFHENVFDWLYFKGNTISLLNSKMPNLKEALSDETIKAICTLIILETFTGNLNEASAHMGGLQRIAAVRQKENSLPYLTAHRVTEAVVKLAALSNTKPNIPFTLKLDFPLPLPDVSHILPTLGSWLILQWPQVFSNEELIPLLYDMATMTRYTEAVYSWIYPHVEDDSYSEYISHQILFIEHRLLSYASRDAKEECCRLACLLYVNTCLVRGYSNASALIHNLVVALKEALQKYDATNMDLVMNWEGCEHVLFWVLFLGFCCSRGEEEEGYLRVELLNTACTINITNCEDAKTVLSNYFFVDSIYLDMLRDVSKHFF